MWTVIAAAAASAASPTYLACYLDQTDQKLSVDVAIDEANQTATIALPSGRMVKRDAIISPNQVRIPDDNMVWVIDRVSLAFQRTLTFSETYVETGKCEVKPAPAERAF